MPELQARSPVGERAGGNHTLVFLSVSSFLPSPSLKIKNKIFKKKKLSWLECCPDRPRVQIDPWSGHIQVSTNECIQK